MRSWKKMLQVAMKLFPILPISIEGFNVYIWKMLHRLPLTDFTIEIEDFHKYIILSLFTKKKNNNNVNQRSTITLTSFIRNHRPPEKFVTAEAGIGDTDCKLF